MRERECAREEDGDVGGSGGGGGENANKLEFDLRNRFCCKI